MAAALSMKALWSLGEHRGEEEEACEAALLGFLSAEQTVTCDGTSAGVL